MLNVSWPSQFLGVALDSADMEQASELDGEWTMFIGHDLTVRTFTIEHGVARMAGVSGAISVQGDQLRIMFEATDAGYNATRLSSFVLEGVDPRFEGSHQYVLQGPDGRRLLGAGEPVREPAIAIRARKAAKR